MSEKSHPGHQKKSRKRNNNVDTTEDEDFFEIEWIGLCPSQVEKMKLPAEVFQELTINDKKRLDSLLVSRSPGTKPFVERGHNKAQKLRELKAMRKYKVELEALHWKGKDYLSQFVYETVLEHESSKRAAAKEEKPMFISVEPQHRLGFDFIERSGEYGSDDEVSEMTESKTLI